MNTKKYKEESNIKIKFIFLSDYSLNKRRENDKLRKAKRNTELSVNRGREVWIL